MPGQSGRGARLVRVLRTVLLVGLLGLSVAVAAVAGLFLYYTSDPSLPTIDKTGDYHPKVVTRVPVTTGATLRRLLQVRAVRHVQKELGSYFNNNRVLFLSGMRNYDIAVALSDYTKNLSFADALFQTGAPTMLTSLEQLELYAKGSEWMLSGKPGEMLESALSGFKGSRIASVVAKSHVIVGTFAELKAVGNAKNLEGKTLITSAVDEERLAFFTKCKVNLVVDVSPKLFDKVDRKSVV